MSENRIHKFENTHKRSDYPPPPKHKELPPHIKPTPGHGNKNSESKPQSIPPKKKP